MLGKLCWPGLFLLCSSDVILLHRFVNSSTFLRCLPCRVTPIKVPCLFTTSTFLLLYFHLFFNYLQNHHYQLLTLSASQNHQQTEACVFSILRSSMLQFLAHLVQTFLNVSTEKYRWKEAPMSNALTDVYASFSYATHLIIFT